ncbi:hypothetical protein ACFV2X_48100 [Streptomyces sp. NPDC059679]|uniref:hypothetical protein n=1 Tax=Streptomyces sp. NPDC059679 TaxID=3346903 RepID=UPI0036CFE89A
MMPKTALRLALFGALAAAFDGGHPWWDQWAQRHHDAVHKGRHGADPVYLDGTPVVAAPERQRAGERVVTETRLGRRACTGHVLTYSMGQVITAVAITRSAGYRIPARALLVGSVINAGTHWVLDRRQPLLRAARALGKQTYLEYGTVVRKPGEDPDAYGPGSAVMELDQAAHRLVGVMAAAVTTWLATR